MILLIEPMSRNIGMYVPAYPLPLIEIASFVKSHLSWVEIGIISVPVDYGIPLTKEGKEEIYEALLQDIFSMNPRGVGISCTAIAQAEETLEICQRIKTYDPTTFIFLGGYFPTIYYEDILNRTSAVDLIVTGEGEIPTLMIAEHLERGNDPMGEDIPNLVWKHDDHIYMTRKGERFDLRKKAHLDLDLLRVPKSYDILPYSFSRGCPYHCNFCMEQFLRSSRKVVPTEIVRADLTNLSKRSNAHTLLVSDALFQSFSLFPFMRNLGMKINFETRCDVLDPAMIKSMADVCGTLVLGFESASYDTLKRMNKVRDKKHYEKYISNTKAIFKEAVKNEIPTIVFMIAGYPGDKEQDLEKSLSFAKDLSKNDGPGGYVFKIGECHIYPKTKIHELALSLPDVVFDDDGVLGQNIVRQPSKGLDFETVLRYMEEIFNLSNHTVKMNETIQDMMPFFRMPVKALEDEMLPDTCYQNSKRDIFDVKGESLKQFKALAPRLRQKYEDWRGKERSTRTLQL